ncbi:VOC family protein [Nigerium massiliense]|uniref:VOC family protein n=1 Tax=Nigerium massiliense TaxID=1522317 RepID=UPI00058C3D24|nr:VOC family protein [Nigerium massiliense]
MTDASTCLWFSSEDAPKAIELYTTLIPGSRVVETQQFDNEQQTDHSVSIWTIEIAGRTTHVMGADHSERFTTAHSMWLIVDDQEQLDRVWDGFLAAGGTEMQCGWIVDPFGLPWQVLPAAWERLTSGDPARAQRVVEALWQMVRIDVAALEAAARG